MHAFDYFDFVPAKKSEADKARSNALESVRSGQNEWDYLIYRVSASPEVIEQLSHRTHTEIATFVVHRML